MNEQIANIVKLYVKPLPWAQVVVGLAKSAIVNTPSGNPDAPTFTRRTFPVPCVAPDVCTVDNLPTLLIPDESKRAIVYFEDNGTSFVSQNGNAITMVSQLKLVCWLNPQFFTSPRCNITTLVVADIIRNMPTNPFNMGGMTRIQIKFKGEEVRNYQSIFGRYSYNTIQHLFMPPYDFFAIRFEVSFTVDAACMDEVGINEEPCPTPNEFNPDFDCPDCPTIPVPGCCTLAQMADVQAAIDALQLQIDNIPASVPSVDVQSFVTVGANTWTKPTGAKTVEVIVIGAGGGGGSGRQGLAGTVRTGGAGGGSGARHRVVYDATLIGVSEVVNVGVGGLGGALVGTINTNGNAGGTGGNSSFGLHIKAQGGGGGGGGTTVAATGGTGYTGILSNGANGGNSSNGGGNGNAGSTPTYGSTGGGAGGGITVGDGISNGGAGGSIAVATVTHYTNDNVVGGLAGVGGAGGSNGGNGISVTSTYIGTGGGGGGSSKTAASWAGGNGSVYGGGGGGGGASLNGFNSGAGGNGGDGIVIVITSF